MVCEGQTSGGISGRRNENVECARFEDTGQESGLRTRRSLCSGRQRITRYSLAFIVRRFQIVIDSPGRARVDGRSEVELATASSEVDWSVQCAVEPAVSSVEARTYLTTDTRLIAVL